MKLAKDIAVLCAIFGGLGFLFGFWLLAIFGEIARYITWIKWAFA